MESTSFLKRRRSSITQQLLMYHDMFSTLFSKRTSRSSFSGCEEDPETYKSTNQENNNLIHLKSHTTDNPSNAPPRRKSVESSELHHVDRVNTITSVDRFSTCLTPTATCFSTDELNEIFNIGRENTQIPYKGDVLNSPAQTSVHDISTHNMAFNSSNISIDSIDLSSNTENVPPPITETPTTETNSPQKKKSRDTLKPLNLTPTKEETFENGQILNVRAPFTPSPDGRCGLSHVQMISREIFMTERSYVNDLQEVIEGYIYHMKQQMDLDVENIFGNLEDIYEFNKDVLYQLEQCETMDNEIDPIEMAKVFVEKARGFNHHYAQYCTNYPEASSFFSIIMQDHGIAQFFLERQRVIGHALSLESYLLKPVQRIMKYHLLFRDILKKYDAEDEGYDTINTAMLAMTDVAEYINEMKRLHENAMKVQQILSHVVDLDVPIDVFSTGRLVLENTFKVQGARGDRIMYLFEKLLLICKKTEDKLYQFKEKIECSNMMLVESMPKDPLAFLIMRFDNQKVNYTIVAKTLEIKKEWTQHLKRLILETHEKMIPQTARQAILGEEKAKSKYNSLPLNALEDSVVDNLRNLTKATSKTTLVGKENVALSAGVKRESNEKESYASKRSLNVKAKEYLLDKRGRTLGLQPSPDKEKKEKKWRKKHKQKPSLDSSALLEIQNTADLENNLATTKSRSLESLKDKISHQDSVENHTPPENNIIQQIIQHKYENEVIQDTDTKRRYSRPISMAEADEIADKVLTATKNKISDSEQENSSELHIERRSKILKSKSLNVSKGIVDNPKRWSKLSESDPMDVIEKRLSLLSDDDMSSTSIKNMVRKVSNAFNSSFQAYDDSSRSVIANDKDVPHDLDIVLTPEIRKASYRRSTGDMSSKGLHVSSMRIGRSRSELSVFHEKGKLESDTQESTETMNFSLEDTKEAENENEENRWSADVDQVFDEVNADLDSIADSLTSNKSNESVNDLSVTTGNDINVRAALVDARLKQANEESNMSPDSARKINYEVKNVADRIKEYKKLIDSEKQRNSWKRQEPRTMNEMIENLDSISTVNNGLSPVYATHRRRFKSSRDHSNEEQQNSDDMSHAVSADSSENINSEKETSRSRNGPEALMRSSLTSNLISASDNRLSDSSSSIGSNDMKKILETESIAKRTERYRQALRSFDEPNIRKSPVPVQKQYSFGNEGSTLDSRKSSCTKENILSDDAKDTDSDNNRENVLLSVENILLNEENILETSDENDELSDKRLSDVVDNTESQLDSDDWSAKACSLPNPRRSNAIKRTSRQSSNETLDSDVAKEKVQFQKSLSIEVSRITRPLERTKPKSSGWVDVAGKRSRSLSVPPEINRDVNKTEKHSPKSDTTIDFPSRLASRTFSDSSNSSAEGKKSRGRSDVVKTNINSAGSVCSSKYTSLPRPKKGGSKKNVPASSEQRSNSNGGVDNPSSHHRSTSLPRRMKSQPKSQLDIVKKELDDNHNAVLRSPSMRCIQQNHVNVRIKNYFTNLQKSSRVTRSRPNLLLVGSFDESDSDNDDTSSSTSADGSNSPNPSNNNTDHILRGTVRSMIKRYGQANYVFDSF